MRVNLIALAYCDLSRVMSIVNEIFSAFIKRAPLALLLFFALLCYANKDGLEQQLEVTIMLLSGQEYFLF